MPASLSVSKEVEKPVDEFLTSFPLSILALHEAPKTIMDIAFVHSLSGDLEKTWASPWTELVFATGSSSEKGT
jgi:hypothetical protein